MALIKKYNAGGKADFRNYVVSKLLSDESLSASEQELISKGLSSFEPSKEINEDTGNFSGRVKDEATTFAWLNQANKEFIKNTPEQIQLMPEGGWGPEYRSPEGFNKYLQKNLYGDNEHSFVRAIGDMTDNDKIKQFVVKNAKDYTNSYLSDAAREAEHRPENEWAKKDEMQQAQNVLSGIDENKTISETDWNAVVDALRKLGDDPVEFLRDSKQLEAIERNRIAKEQRDKLEQSKIDLKNLGVDDDLLEQIQGFSIDNDYEPFEDLPFLKKVLEEGNYTLIQSPDKSVQALLKNGKLVKNAGGLVTDDQLSPHFGKTWGTAENGEFLIFDKENIDENKFFDWDTIGVDEFETQNVGREILTTDPKFAGYKIVGYSGDDQKGFKDTDIFGRRQFTKEFTFTKDGKTFKVIRGDDGIYRKEGEKKRFTMPTTMSFGEGIEEVAKDYKKTYFRNQGSPLYMLDMKPISTTSKRMGIKGIPTREEIFADAETTIKQFEKAYEKAVKDKKDVAIKQADNKRLAEFLTHVLTDPKYSEEDREWAEKLVHRQTALALKKIYDKKTNQEIPLFDTPLFMWKKGGIIEPATKFDPEKFRKWKEGGVLKAEQGSSLTDFYKASSELSKSRPAAAESSAETGDGTVSSGYHDPTGTVADSNFLDWLSVGGTALAFVPGVGGVVGGLVSTAADAANAAFRGEWTPDDTKKLLSNIGFTALSAIGLGAAKGIGMAGKSARVGKGLWGFGKAGKAVGKTVEGVKTMGTAEKVARVAKTASARAKVMGPSGKSIVKAADRLENLTKAADKTGKGSSLVSKVLKGDKKALADITNSGYKSVEAVLKDYKAVNNLGSVKTTWYGQAGQGIVKGVKNLANLDLSKVGKGIGYGMSAAQIAGGVGSGITIAGNVRDEGHLWKGIKKSKMSDVERLAQSAVLSYGWRQNVLNRRAVDKHTIKKYAKEPSVTLSVTDKNGDLVKNIPLKNNALVEKTFLKDNASAKKMGKSWWGKKFSSQGEKEITAIEKDLVNLVGKDDLELIKKAVLDGGVVNPIVKAGVPTKIILMDTKVDMSSPEDVRSFLRAERVLTRGQGNFFKRATPQEIYRQSDIPRRLNPGRAKIARNRRAYRLRLPENNYITTSKGGYHPFSTNLGGERFGHPSSWIVTTQAPQAPQASEVAKFSGFSPNFINSRRSIIANRPVGRPVGRNLDFSGRPNFTRVAPVLSTDTGFGMVYNMPGQDMLPRVIRKTNTLPFAPGRMPARRRGLWQYTQTRPYKGVGAPAQQKRLGVSEWQRAKDMEIRKIRAADISDAQLILPSNYKKTPEYMNASTAEKRRLTRMFNKQPKENIQGSLFKRGGILSFRTGGPAYMDTAPSWEPPAYMDTMFPWERDAYLKMPHLWEQTPYGTQPPPTNLDFKRYLPDMKTATVVEGARPTIPTLEQYENSNPAPDSNPNLYPEDPGLLVDVLGVDPFDRNKIRPKNWGPAFEFGRFLTSEWHNNLSTNKRIRGLADSIPTLSGVSSPHLRTGSPLTMEAHRQVGNLQSGARRAGKTVNVSDYMNAMLTSQKNAADLMMKATSEDANRNRGIREQQMSLDRDTTSKNIALGNQREEIRGRIAKDIANADADFTQKTGENRSALLAGFKKEVADKDRRKLFNDYVVGIQNPNIAKAQEWYSNKTSDEVIANLEKEYLKIEEEKKKYNPRHEIIPYKQSKQYADYIAHINTQMKPISQELARLNQLASVLSIYSPKTKTE